MSIPAPRAHGDDVEQVAAALGVAPDAICDLAATRNPVAPDAVAVLRRHLDTVRRYPDPETATSVLADAIGVHPARLVLTNGGAEAIALVAAEHPVGRVDEPDFSLYARHLTRVDPAGPRWRSNPHNPTGRLAPAGERAAVWDEAFYPLATGRWTRGDDDATVVGSLTKLWGCPGLRLGYVLAPCPEEAARLRRRQPEWAVGSLALAVVPDLLAVTDLAGWAARIRALRTHLVDLLRGHGLAPEPSDAPFVFLPGVPGLRDHLAHRLVLVRACDSFGRPDAVRIAVPDERGLERLDRALLGRG